MVHIYDVVDLVGGSVHLRLHCRISDGPCCFTTKRRNVLHVIWTRHLRFLTSSQQPSIYNLLHFRRHGAQKIARLLQRPSFDFRINSNASDYSTFFPGIQRSGGLIGSIEPFSGLFHWSWRRSLRRVSPPQYATFSIPVYSPLDRFEWCLCIR